MSRNHQVLVNFIWTIASLLRGPYKPAQYRRVMLPIRDEDLPKLRKPCEEYLKREVLPHVPDAWIDHAKTEAEYEIPLTRHFCNYQPPRPLNEIEADIKALEADIVGMLGGITNGGRS